MEWLEEFKNPTPRNRIKPFWFWNGDMNEKVIEHQIKEMTDKGLGGVFIAARQGLKIPYLSKEWFERVSFAIEKAADYGLEAWLYDEYPYPSGMSGGEVLLRHPEAEHMVLNHKTLIVTGEEAFEINLGLSELLYAKAFRIVAGELLFDNPVELEDRAGNLQTEEIYQTTGLTKYNNKRFFSYNPEIIIKGSLPKGEWRIEIYTQSKLGEFKYYGGYFDPCSKEAVKTFLATTHEKYAKYLQNGFGNKIFGMFSDEVGLLSPIPWSKRLPEYFQKLKGYNLLENLPALHNSTYNNAYQIRYDLYDSIHKLFVESYHKQVADWCKEHKLEYATEVPFMRMTTQRNSTIAGGDTAHEKLGRELEWIYDEYIKHYRANAKAVSSLTRQLGNKYAMIESFHSVGWTMTMQDAKWMYDRLAASGINFYNVHAFYYTIASIAKHDAPPSQFLQNPYWKHYKLLADYAGRLSTWVTNTEAQINTAVLDPVANLWVYLGEPFGGFNYKGEDEAEKKKCEELKNKWVDTCKRLLFNQIDYEHLDSELFAEAVIEDRQIKLGRATYRVLIIPPTKFIEEKAYKKICEFALAGGEIIVLEKLPEYIIDKNQEMIDWNSTGYFRINGISKTGDNGCMENLSVFESIEEEKWIELCREKAQQPFEIIAGSYIDTDNYNDKAECIAGERLTEKKCAKKDIISSVREADGKYYVFLTNQGGKNTYVKVIPRLKGYENTTELMLDTGELKTVNLEAGKVFLESYQSRLICFSKEDRTDTLIQPRKLTVNTRGKMPVSIEGKNIYRLDKFKISRDQINWLDVPVKTFIEQCSDNNCLGQNDYEFKGDFGTPKKISVKYPVKVYYSTDFLISELPETIGILMDKGAVMDTFKIRLNNSVIDNNSFKGIFVNDQNNVVCDITPYIKKGINKLIAEVDITKDSDGIRDPLYLYGEFGVSEPADGRRTIVSVPKEAAFDLNYIKGFPYYSGTFNFITKLNVQEQDVNEKYESYEIRLDIGNECHECIELLVNGKTLGAKAFSPYVWKCNKEDINIGSNGVEIKLTNTLAPMLDGIWFDYDKHCLVEC